MKKRRGETLHLVLNQFTSDSLLSQLLKMPFLWTRNSRRIITQYKKHNFERNKNKDSNSRDQPKSFDESILLTRNSSSSSSSSMNSCNSKTCSIFSSRDSVFSGFDSDMGSEVAEVKKAYPLPKPSCSDEPPTDFKTKLITLGSDMVSRSSTSSSESACSTCNADGVDSIFHEHGDFGSFRAVEESDGNSWSITSCPGSKASATRVSPLPPMSDAGLQSLPKKQESSVHPRHPLPLPPTSPTKSPRNLISGWKKGKLIGRGTFGHVYVGFNSENGQMCAMKEVRFISDDHNSKECLKQLNQEIALLSEQSHPNIVQYYGCKLAGDKLSVYLEYVSGGSIQKLLSEYGPFTEPVIRSYTEQILSGLAYLHGRKTLHRDIKGANILVDPNGEIKLADFGMARHMTSCCSMLSFKGSPYWMAPEVIMNTSSSGYSLAVDIWSLGCTILEMATSKPPWSQYEGVAAIFKIANCKEYPAIPCYLSEDAQAFVKLCLQRDPSARPTAAQLLHHPFIQNQSHKRICDAQF